MTRKDTRRLVDLTVDDARRVLVYAAATLLAVLLIIALVWEVAVALLLGVVVGGFLLPLQEFFERRLRRSAGSALVTMAVIIVPLVGLFAYGWHELSRHSNSVVEGRDQIADSISRSLSRYNLPLEYEATRETIKSAFTEAVVRSGEALGEIRKKTALILTAATLFFFTVYYVLTQRLRLASYIKLRVPGDFLPLYEKLTENVGGALRGAVWAVFIDQGIKAGIIFICNLVFGVPLAVALALLAFVTGFFPLIGIWIVYIPISVYLLVFRGDPTAAAVYFGIGTTLTFFSSFFLRPMLAARETRSFNFYWMLVALVAGVYAFGVPGVVLGPAIIGFAKAVLDTLVGEVRYETSLLKEEHTQQAEQAAEEQAAADAEAAEQPAA
jgi:predicted PurR-regulated permease PerM